MKKNGSFINLGTQSGTQTSSVFKKTYLSLSVAMIISGGLTACSSSSNNDSNASVELNPTSASGLICIDQNNNGQCDVSEPSVADQAAGNIPSTMMSDKYPRLLEITDGSLYIAAPGSSIISAYSTAIANERLFNPTVNDNAVDAAAYLFDKLSLAKNGSITEADAVEFQASIKTALAANPDVHSAKVIAAVMDKIIAENKFSVTVSSDDVVSEKIAKRDITLQGTALNWEQSDGDETPDFIMPLAGRNLTAMTMHYHNRLMIIDTSGDAPVITSNALFANVEGERYTIDATSGASEHRLRGAKSSPDGQYVYINIRPSDGDDSVGNENDDKYGLFRVTVNDDGSVGSHDDVTTLRYESAYVGDFEIVNGKIHLEDLDAQVTRILNLDLSDTGETVTANTALQATLDGLTNIEEQFTSPDGMYLYVTTEGVEADNTATPPVIASANKLHKINKNDGVVSATIEIDTLFEMFTFFDDGKQALAYQDNYAATIDLENMVIITTLPLGGDVRDGSGVVSADNKYIAFASTSDAVWVFDLNAIDVNIIASFDAGERIRALDIDDNNNMYVAGRGFAHVKKLNFGDILTPEQIITLDKTAVIEGDINGGASLATVITDLSLATTIPAGYGSTIMWSSTSSSVNTTFPSADNEPDLGALIRPENGEGSEAGTLTANLNFSFRDISIDDSKEFNFSIRQKPIQLPVASIIKTENNSSQYPAANTTGDIMLAPVRFENANGNDVYGFIGINVVNGTPQIVSGSASIPKTYVDTESLVGVGIYGAYGIGVSAAVEVGEDAGQARIFTIAMDSSGVLAESVTTSIIISSGAPQKVGFNQDQSIAAVMIKQDDDSYITEVYSIGAAGEISLLHTISMVTADYANYGPPAINATGSRAYQRDGEDKIFMTNSDGTSASATVDEIARVWFYNERVFVNTYDGNIVSFNETLDESSRTMFYTGTGGRMYGAAGRELNGKHYLFIPLQQASDMDSNRESNLNGIYQLEIKADGSLEEIAFSQKVEGADRMTVSGDGSTVFFSYRDRSGDDSGRYFGVVTMPATEE